MTSQILDYLKSRRSAKITHLAAPGPSKPQLDEILTIAARVPDHGKYAPWYFIVFEGDARKDAGDLLREAYAAENPDAAGAKLDLEGERFLRAPLVVAVVSRPRPGKHRQWEQILSAGAACLNLCHAANAQGFGTNWLTEWYAYSPHFRQALGLDARDHIAGVVYIGTASAPNEERERPDLGKIVTRWKKGEILNKGDEYGVPDKPMPEAGFVLT